MPPGEIPFFLDQNVADSVAAVLKLAGHKVTRLREVMHTESPDPVVAIAATLGDQVLVSHDKDFKPSRQKGGSTKRKFEDRLHRVRLCCPEPIAADRIRVAMTVIQTEWALATKDQPMVVEVYDKTIRIWR